MFIPIIWGKKTTVKFIGYAADFCAIDRAIQPFRVNQVFSGSHVYGIPTGSTPIAYVIVCKKCQTRQIRTDIPYKQLLESDPSSANDLISMTYPDIYEVHHDRLGAEELIRNNPRNLSRELRYSLIQEPFSLLSGEAESA